MVLTNRQRFVLPQQLSELFARASGALEEYFAHVQTHSPSERNAGLAREAARLLWQVSYSATRVHQSLADSFQWQMSRGFFGPVKLDEHGRIVHDCELAERLTQEGFKQEDQDASDEAGRVVVFYVEACYRCAFGLRKVLSEMPGLGAFNPEGVRDVRNWILEHPKQPITSWGWSTDPKSGPRLRPARRQPPQDSGLWPNLAEFEEELTSMLRRWIDQKQSCH